MTIRLVLFDMDDVVYAYSRARRIAYLADMTGLSAGFIEDRIWFSGQEDAADAGAYRSPEDYLAAFSASLGAEISADLWVAARRAGMTAIAGTLAIIEGLVANGRVTVGVLTNNGPMVKSMRHALVPDLARLAGDNFLVSSQFNCRKPDPECFARAVAHLGFSPAECFFTDDLGVNVAGACEAGLDGHVFRGPEGLAAALQAVSVTI